MGQSITDPEETGLTTVIPARVRPIADRAVDLLTDDTDAADNDRFYFTAEISSTSLDSYFTHMDPSTLRNFARDAATGVSLLDSHDSYKLGIGYSAAGRYEEEGETGRAIGVFYIVPGIRFGGKHSFASTDDFIRAIQGEVVRDVSVGFYGGQWICDLCHQPYFGRGTACQHIAGYEYEIEVDGKMTRQQCTVAIHDANLSEVSLVYDGATPGAMILKAEQEAEAGRLSPVMIRQIEKQYRVKLPKAQPAAKPQALGVASAAAGRGTGERAMTEENTNVEQPVEQPEAGVVELDGENAADAEARAALEAIRQILTQSAAPQGVHLADAVRWLNEQLAQATQERDAARQETARLQPLADQGQAYREDLVTQALAEGVRAMGEAFPEETYRAMLTDAPLEHIRQVRDTFATQAAERLPGGRQTRDNEEENKQSGRTAIPPAAYGVRS